MTHTIFKYKVTIYKGDCVVEGKYSSLRELNADLNLDWTNTFLRRLYSKKRVDLTGRMNEYAFINKYAHIKVEKIREPRDFSTINSNGYKTFNTEGQEIDG